MIKTVLMTTLTCAHLLAPVTRAADSAKPDRVGPWTLTCEGAPARCAAAQTRVSEDPAHPVTLKFEVFKVADQARMRVTTSPIAQPRVRLRTEDQRAIFLTTPVCSSAGCTFELDLDPESLEGLAQQNMVEISVAVSETEGLAMIFDVRALAPALHQLPPSP